MIIPLPKRPPTRLERFARGFFTPSIRLVQKYAPPLTRLEWKYPRLDRFIRSARAKGYTDDQIEEGIKLLVGEMAERMARRKGLKVEQVKPVLEEVLREPVGPERWGREAFKFAVLAAGAVPTAGMSLPLAAATEGALFAGLGALGKAALGEEVTPRGIIENFILGAATPPVLRVAGRLWRGMRGVRPPVTAVEEAEVLAKRMEDVAEQLAKRIETPEDYDDLLSAITEVFPAEAPERAMAEVMDVAKLVPPPRVLAEEAPERVLEELEVITGGIPRAPVREVALPKPPVEEVAKKPYEGLRPGTAEWMRVWREHPELQREMLEYRRQFVPGEIAPPKPKMAPPEVPKEPKVEVPKVEERVPIEVPKPPVKPKKPTKSQLKAKPKVPEGAEWQLVESYSRLKPGDYIRVHYRGKVYEGRIAGKPKRMRSGAVMVPLEGGNRKWAPWTPKAKYERKVE